MTAQKEEKTKNRLQGTFPNINFGKLFKVLAILFAFISFVIRNANPLKACQSIGDPICILIIDIYILIAWALVFIVGIANQLPEIIPTLWRIVVILWTIFVDWARDELPQIIPLVFQLVNWFDLWVT
ncbi:MAG: hypothetical protein AAGD96_35805 [Chloroflexota bacterium]